MHLKRCVARLDNKYVIKAYKNNDVVYRTISATDLKTNYLNMVHSVTDKDGKSKSYPVFNIVIDADYISNHMAKYHGVDILTNAPNVLSLYRPPMIDEDRIDIPLIEHFIKYFEGRVYNLESLHEEFSAHAYRIRHPNVKIVKMFFHHAEEGGLGKSLLMSGFDTLYPGLSMIGVKSREASSDFAGWMTQYLNIGFEELENDEYRNKFFETFIKQATTRKTSSRRMYQETTEGTYKCIFSVNTNSPDLFGLVRADQPTIERLVIVHFKPIQEGEEDMQEFIRSIGFDETLPDFHERMHVFAASFYHYLKHIYKNPFIDDFEKWSPERYYGADKDQIIQRMRLNSDRLPMRFIQQLEINNITHLKHYSFDSYNPFNILVRKARTHRIFVGNAVLESSFNEFIKSLPAGSREKRMYTVASVKDELKRSLGWTDDKIEAGHGLSVDEAEYDKWKQSLADSEDEDDDNDTSDTSSTIISTD